MDNELRKDYFLDRRVIIAVGRGKRPTDFKHAAVDAEKEEDKTCFFCPGNENTTPPEISRVERGGKWIIRVFPNKFPAVTTEEGEVSDNLMPAYGMHEIVVETPDHSKTVADLSAEDISMVLQVYNQRVEAIHEDGKIEYVLVFKNHGKNAGASLSHTHTQIISLPITPKLVLEEAKASEGYKSEKGTCPICDAFQSEKDGPRSIWEDEHTIVFAPYASRSPMEAWVTPKRHIHSLGELSDDERLSFAKGLKVILAGLKDRLNNPPYNLYFHQNPKGYDLHLHVEILPRLSIWAGFELGSDLIINTVAPESAAEFYRQK